MQNLDSAKGELVPLLHQLDRPEETHWLVADAPIDEHNLFDTLHGLLPANPRANGGYLALGAGVAKRIVYEARLGQSDVDVVKPDAVVERRARVFGIQLRSLRRASGLSDVRFMDTNAAPAGGGVNSSGVDDVGAAPDLHCHRIAEQTLRVLQNAAAHFRLGGFPDTEHNATGVLEASAFLGIMKPHLADLVFLRRLTVILLAADLRNKERNRVPLLGKALGFLARLAHAFVAVAGAADQLNVINDEHLRRAPELRR